MKNFRITVAFAVVLIVIFLLPVLYFPISIDHAIFTRGAQALLEGKKLYAQFLDIKPPFIYYVFAAKTAVFGSSEFSLRLFDIAWQGVTLWFLIITVLKRTGDLLAALSSAVMYALLYSTLGFSQSMQCETLSAWGFISLAYLHSERDMSPITSILSGICVGWIIGFKYTLGIVLPVLFLFDMVKGMSVQNLFKNYAIIGFSALAMLLAMLSPLLDNDVRQGYGQILQYLAVYAKFPPLDIATIRFILKATSGFYADRFSLVFVGLVVIGAMQLFKNVGRHWDTPKNRFIALSCFLVIGLVISVFIERKVITYHLSRTYIPLAVIGGIGAAHCIRSSWDLYHSFRNNYSFASSFFILTPVVILIALFSPLPRWVKLLRIPYHFHTNTVAYNAEFDSEDNAVNRTQHKAVAEYITQRKKPGERSFVMSVAASTIQYFMDERPVSKFANPQFYFSYGCLEAWRHDAKREINSAAWLVVQHTDHQPFLNGHYRSSWESLQQDSLLYPPVKSSFSVIDTIGYFYIFKRNQ